MALGATVHDPNHDHQVMVGEAVLLLVKTSNIPRVTGVDNVHLLVMVNNDHVLQDTVTMEEVGDRLLVMVIMVEGNVHHPQDMVEAIGLPMGVEETTQ